MKLSDELITLFDTLNIENQNYALAVLQSLRYAQDIVSKQSQATNKGKKVLSIKNSGDEPPT